MRCSCSRIVVLLATLFLGIALWSFNNKRRYQQILEYQISSDDITKLESGKNCTTDTCLNLLSCSLHDGQLTVFVEPFIRVIDENGKDITPSPSSEYLEIRSVIERSRYRVNAIEDACLVVPGFDTLNIYRFNDDESSFSKNFNAGARLNNHNVLIFAFAGASLLDINAIIARTGSRRKTFRRGFDLSLPLWNPYVSPSSFLSSLEKFSYFIVVPIKFASHNVKVLLKNLFNENDCLVLDECDVTDGNFLCDSRGDAHNLGTIVKESQFTLIDDRVAGSELLLMSALRVGSIPVIISDFIVLPFNEVINWDLLSLTFPRSRLSSVLTFLRVLSSERKQRMREQISFVYSRYFSSLEKIILTTLRILERRIIPNSFTTYDDWNCNSSKNCFVPSLFHPFHTSAEGFTGVILTYNKLNSLFVIIRLLAKVASLRSIVVVWNHAGEPPPMTEWPHINQPIHIIHMDKNMLSNRFIMFSEITTDAIFSLDEDTVAMNIDEIEFGYQTWRENPDRLVGFLPRAAVFNESTRLYEYHTEWANSMNIILMGAAFYHKYYGMLYHELLPSEIIEYVEKNRNCEDIAMNFLISSVTGKSPLKVTPRKKFVYPKCVNSDMSTRNVQCLLQRSTCINLFISYFGYNPLVTSVSRYDPVLYKVPFGGVTNPYSQVGPL
ncbi:Exostosin family protein [Brugia malayi]|uniref:Exostosin family protein n=1 Tax=Brugia malayi TaxID=6279 RepID=A0A4E9FA16_BRUMA|nr:Exostosin family protein [Brugia malayi]VIO93201.1 Exostosin family protein [Brugia malayi]